LEVNEMNFVIRWGWVGAIAFGIALVGAGIYMVYEGRSARDDVRATLADERIITAEDAAIPLAEVDSASEAKAQADIIREHALATTGGKTYAELDRDDPARAVYLNSVTLRTALMESFLAFKVSDLVVGVGAIVVLLGLSHIALGSFLGLLLWKREGVAGAQKELGAALR
jgi:hypothetical protein